MRLFRFAIISILGKAEIASILGKADATWREFSLVRGGARVRVTEAVDDGNGLALFVGADVPLSELPQADRDGLVEVPDEPRRLTEKAIDAAANLLSVATGHTRSVTSRNLPVAFYAENDDDRGFLRAQTAIKSIDRGVSFSRMSVFVTADELTALRGREGGTELLAEALAQHHFAGRYRELLRVFELGFAATESKLAFILAEFLAKRPRLGYTKSEVKQWVQGRRGRATHADRSAPLIGADLGDVVDRMLLAAYEVLFNKENWNTYDSARRDVWTPSIGPLDADGNWFVRQYQTEAPLPAQLYDPYGVYPLNLAASGLQLADQDFWPCSGPLKTTAGAPELTILPAAELAVSTTGRDGQPSGHVTTQSAP